VLLLCRQNNCFSADDAAMATGANGETSEIEEIADDQIGAGSPQKDAKADAVGERAEV
jgi:hypothetical protein